MLLSITRDQGLLNDQAMTTLQDNLSEGCLDLRLFLLLLCTALSTYTHIRTYTNAGLPHLIPSRLPVGRLDDNIPGRHQDSIGCRLGMQIYVPIWSQWH